MAAEPVGLSIAKVPEEAAAEARRTSSGPAVLGSGQLKAAPLSSRRWRRPSAQAW